MSKRSSSTQIAAPCRRHAHSTVCGSEGGAVGAGTARDRARRRCGSGRGIEETAHLRTRSSRDVHRILDRSMGRKLASSAVSRSYSVIAPDATRGTGYGLRRMPDRHGRSGPSRRVGLALDAQLGFPVDSYRERSQTWLVEKAISRPRMALHPVAGYARPRSSRRTTSGNGRRAAVARGRSSMRSGSARRSGRSPRSGTARVLRRARRGTRAATLATTATISSAGRRTDSDGRPRRDRRRVGTINGGVSIVSLLLAQLEA